MYKLKSVLIGAVSLLFLLISATPPRKTLYKPLKDRFMEKVSLENPSQIRQKRLFYLRVRLPYLSSFEIKWALNMPAPSEKEYYMKLQIALPMLIPFPSYMTDSVYTPAFNTLFGGYKQREDSDNFGEDDNSESERKKRYLEVTHYKERLEVYDQFEEALDKQGLPARDCLLRTVCEVAEAPLHFGMLGDFINLLFTPSVVLFSAPCHKLPNFEHLLEAELIGRNRTQPCNVTFASCPMSVFETLPLIQSRIVRI